MSALNSVGVVPSWVSRVVPTCHHALGTFKKYVRSRFQSFVAPSPLVRLCLFLSTSPPSKVRSFWLELTLSLSVFVLAKFRDKKLNSTCLLRSHSRIFIKWTPWQKCALYGDVLFIEIPSNNQKSSEVNMKSTTCHDFPSPDLLEGPKDGKIKENEKFFSF